MYTNIHVMSYEDCESWSRYSKDCPLSIVISIDESPHEYTNIDVDNPCVLDVLRLIFSDTETGPFGMQLEDAERVMRFVNQNLLWNPDIVIHCAAGISRSAGIAAALHRILNGSDSPIVDSTHYAPNFRCYKAMLDAAGMEYDEAADRKRFEESYKRRQKQLKLIWDELPSDDVLHVHDEQQEKREGMTNAEYSKRCELLREARERERAELLAELEEEKDSWSYV